MTVTREAILGENAPTRYRYSATILPAVTLVADAAVILIVAYAAHAAVLGTLDLNGSGTVMHLVIFLGMNLALINFGGLYHIEAIMRPVKYSDQLIVVIFTSTLFFLGLLHAFGADGGFPYAWLYATAAGCWVGLCGARVMMCRLFRYLSRRRVIGSSLAVYGAPKQIGLLLERVAHLKPYFTTVLGAYSDDHGGESGVIESVPLRGGLRELIAAVRANDIEDVVVAVRSDTGSEIVSVIEQLKELPVNVYISTDLFGMTLELKQVLGQFEAMPTFEVVERPISGWRAILKALEDYILASAILIFLSPLLLIVAAAIKLDSPGPVLFRQSRLGFNNKEFSIYKFRSMYHRPEDAREPVAQATRDDPRVTPVGRIIRATSIDELPQLFNVLNGTMSLVGPRPHALSHNQEYGRRIRGYFARHKVKPGITGWAQVKGFRGETARLELMQARVAHDVYYADNWSLLFDFRILLMTFTVVLSQKNAY